MIRSDRIFGLVVIVVALAFIASATQIRTNFLSDPVGPKTFPYIIGGCAILAALVMILRPDPEPDWPALATLGTLALSVAAMIFYAYALKPLGFLLPTFLVASVLSYQIAPRPLFALLTGLGLSLGLFAIFKYALGLGLVALPKFLT